MLATIKVRIENEQIPEQYGELLFRAFDAKGPEFKVRGLKTGNYYWLRRTDFVVLDLAVEATID